MLEGGVRDNLTGRQGSLNTSCGQNECIESIADAPSRASEGHGFAGTLINDPSSYLRTLH